MTANEDFQALVRPGVLIRFVGDNGAVFQAKVRSCHWVREYVTVHVPVVPNPQKVPAYAIVDVVPDKTDIDSVEEWLEQPPLSNPYSRPLRGPLATFYVDPLTGTVRMGGNTDQGVKGARPVGVVVDEAMGDCSKTDYWLNRAFDEDLLHYSRVSVELSPGRILGNINPA